MEDIKMAERIFADKTAAEYRRKGYEVLQDEALDFLPGFRADLLVRKGGKTKVVAVQTKTSLAANPKILELADALRVKPCWSFELLLVGEPERLDAPQGARPYKVPDIGRRIAEAENALSAELNNAAFLLAWSACEAAVRILVSADGLEIKRVTWPSHTLGHAVTRGILSDKDDDFLSEMLALRNALSHGFDTDGPTKEQTRDLITAAKTLQQAAESPRRGSAALDAQPNLLGTLVESRAD